MPQAHPPTAVQQQQQQQQQVQVQAQWQGVEWVAMCRLGVMLQGQQ
jgi:hypothetical protein